MSGFGGRLGLLFEFLTLFLGLPLAFRYAPVKLPALPVLWVATAYCYWVLRSTYPEVRLWDWDVPGRVWLGMLLLFLLVGGFIAANVWRHAPRLLFSLPRKQPGLWALIMVLYPVLSVLPQGIVYRAFLFTRYRPLFGGNLWLMIALSAGCFAFMHIVFRNPVAVWLTFAGGLLFAWRYGETGSLPASSVEHALYGCLMFTVGLGEYFYHGTYRAAQVLQAK